MRSLIRRPAPDTTPRDPAPTRLGYRYQRLMLTPGFRATVRIGVPILLIATIAGSWYSKPENRAGFAATVEATKQDFQQRPQFMVRTMNVTGADLSVVAGVAPLLPTSFPVSSFDLDLEDIRTRIEALDPIQGRNRPFGWQQQPLITVQHQVPAPFAHPHQPAHAVFERTCRTEQLQRFNNMITRAVTGD